MAQSNRHQVGPKEAPDSIRDDPELVAIHVEREVHAQRARDAQAKYRRQVNYLIGASTVSAILGGLLLYGVEGSQSGTDSSQLRQVLSDRNVRVGLGLAQAVSLGAVAWLTYLLSGSEVGRVWLDHRMKAEQGRVDRALAAIRIGHRNGPESFKAAIEYASKELIDGQINYFEKAFRQQELRSGRLLKWGAGIACLGAAMAATQGLGISWLLVLAAFVGVLSPALMAAVTSWEAASGDRDRAKASFAAWQALNRINGKRAELARAIEANDLASTEAFFAQAVTVLQADHAAFEAVRKAALQTAVIGKN